MKEAYTRVGFEPLGRKKKRRVFPHFGIFSHFFMQKASFVRQAESGPDLHKVFVSYVLLISNLQLNWRAARGSETKLSAGTFLQMYSALRSGPATLASQSRHAASSSPLPLPLLLPWSLLLIRVETNLC